jgi:acetyltransferase-like isoleucine patch superfamily enzyme
MKDIFKRIFYRLILYFERQRDQANIYYQTKKLIMGKGSNLYKQAVIHNMQGNSGNITVGNNTTIGGELLTFNYGGRIAIGDDCYVGTGSRIWSGEKIVIGSNVLISHNVNIMDTSAHETDHMERAEGYKKLATHGYPKEKGAIKTAPIVIHDHVWISFNATVLKGVTIGKGAIVGANSLVTKDVPAFAFVAGNPATVLKYLKQQQE